MKLFSASLSVVATAFLLSSTFIQSANALSLTIRNDVPGNSSSPILYGLMYEDINRCGDGGMYGQMLRNWNFQKDDTGTKDPSTEFWSAVGDGAKIVLDDSVGLNDANKNSLRLDVSSVETPAGIANDGWWGVRVQPDETYTASFFSKSNGYSGNINVSLQTNDGTVLASAIPEGKLSSDFQQFSVTLKPKVASTSVDNRFVVSVDSDDAVGSSIYFQVLSLFGETFADRKNGLRQDIGKALNDLNPSFFRFPGGNNLEGVTIPQRWKFQQTIGPLEERVGRLGDWSYWNTNGQGLLDYMYMCEDLGMEPILDVYAGYSLDGSSVAEEDLGPYVDEVMDELEYLTGSKDSKWGALRASHGHSEPFDIKYIEIGNEDWFSTTYDYRYKVFYDAITKAYPDVTIIETAEQSSRPWDIYDDHYYNDGKEMIGNFDHYDNYPRNGTGIFVGEFGTNVKGCCGNSSATLEAALADAVFMTGLERNSDLVKMIAYAPSMKRVGHEQWNPDMIHFDTEAVWLTPSYHVFQQWSINRADTILEVDHSDGGFGPLYWVVGSKKETEQIFVKMVNTGSETEKVSFNLKNAAIHSQGIARVITGSNLDDENTKDKSTVTAKESTFSMDTLTSFTYSFEPYSATVLLLHLQK